MRVGRGDGSTDDADVCGLRTGHHTRPEVKSMCVHVGLAAWKACVCVHVGSRETLNSHKTPLNYATCGPPHQADHHTHAGGAVWLVRYHRPSRMHRVSMTFTRRLCLLLHWGIFVGLHVCTSPGRDTGDMGRARGHLHRTLQPLMTILGRWCLPGDVMCVCWCV
jgi:hypothetical protein